MTPATFSRRDNQIKARVYVMQRGKSEELDDLLEEVQDRIKIARSLLLNAAVKAKTETWVPALADDLRLQTNPSGLCVVLAFPLSEAVAQALRASGFKETP